MYVLSNEIFQYFECKVCKCKLMYKFVYLNIVRLGPSPKLKLKLKGLDQRRTLNLRLTTTTHHPPPQTFLPVPE